MKKLNFAFTIASFCFSINSAVYKSIDVIPGGWKIYCSPGELVHGFHLTLECITGTNDIMGTRRTEKLQLDLRKCPEGTPVNLCKNNSGSYFLKCGNCQ